MGQGEECVCALGRRYVLVRTIDSPAVRERVGKTGAVGSKRQQPSTSAFVGLLPTRVAYSAYRGASHNSRLPRWPAYEPWCFTI